MLNFHFRGKPGPQDSKFASFSNFPAPSSKRTCDEKFIYTSSPSCAAAQLDSHPGILKNEQHVDWKIQKPNFSFRESYQYHHQLKLSLTDPLISQSLPSTLRSIPFYNASAKSIQIFFNLPTRFASSFQKPTSSDIKQICRCIFRYIICIWEYTLSINMSKNIPAFPC